MYMWKSYDWMFSVLCYFRNDLLGSLHLRKEELIGCYFPSVSKLTQYFTKLKYFFRVSPIPPASLHRSVTNFLFVCLFLISVGFFFQLNVLANSPFYFDYVCRMLCTWKQGIPHQFVVAINICFSQGLVYLFWACAFYNAEHKRLVL
jgi:hypothetical protein